MAETDMAAANSYVEVSRATRLAESQVVRFSFPEPINDVVINRGAHMVNLCLTPRPPGARARFRDVWARNRYERFGTVVLIPAGIPAETRAEAGDEQKSVVSWLDPSTLVEWLDAREPWPDHCLSGALDIQAPEIRQIMFRIARELEAPGLASDTLLELLNLQLAIELGRFFGSLPSQEAGGLAPWRLKRIDERIAASGKSPMLAELAGLVDMSVRQLTRGFRECRGMSIGDYIEARRIADARRLLQGRQSIKEIAFHMGFATPASFSYSFRAATGEAPRAYRSRARGACFIH